MNCEWHHQWEALRDRDTTHRHNVWTIIAKSAAFSTTYNAASQYVFYLLLTQINVPVSWVKSSRYELLTWIRMQPLWMMNGSIIRLGYCRYKRNAKAGSESVSTFLLQVALMHTLQKWLRCRNCPTTGFKTSPVTSSKSISGLYKKINEWQMLIWAVLTACLILKLFWNIIILIMHELNQ